MTQVSNTARAAALFDILGNAKRLQMFRYLLERELSVGEITKLLDTSHSATSQHLAKMRNTGTVTARREKQTIYYSCDSELVRELIKTMDQFCMREAQTTEDQQNGGPGDDE